MNGTRSDPCLTTNCTIPDEQQPDKVRLARSSGLRLDMERRL
jgi:hypothetical protein